MMSDTNTQTDEFLETLDGDAIDPNDDAFVDEVNYRWGAEETELRQALYFQFIKTKAMANSGDFNMDRNQTISEDEQALDRVSINSDEEDALFYGENRSSKRLKM